LYKAKSGEETEQLLLYFFTRLGLVQIERLEYRSIVFGKSECRSSLAPDAKQMIPPGECARGKLPESWQRLK
jgi:hypothetical protein